jgi:hypothetical protein
LIRQNLPDEKQEYRMTPDEFDVGFVSGGKEAGRYLENMIYRGVLQIVCGKGISSNHIKVLRLMLITASGDKTVDTDKLVKAFQTKQVIGIPVGKPLVLEKFEIIKKSSDEQFKELVQYGGDPELDIQCGNISFPEWPG